MSDPLSISASVLAVLGTAISISKAITAMIQAYDEAPVEIAALRNEIIDLAFVLEQVRSRALHEYSVSRLATLLARADTKFEELRQFVASLGVIGTAGKWRRNFERVKWTEKKRKAQELKSELYHVKDNMMLFLCTGILYQVHKTDANLGLISQSLEATALRDKNHCNETSNKMIHYGLQLSELLKKVEPIQKMIEEQQSQRDMLKVINCALATLTPPAGISPGMSNQIAAQFQNYTPQLRWFLGRVISMAIVSKLEPTASLKMPRVVASNAEIIRLVVIRDVEGIKSLFEQGKASPNDINKSGGTSLLQCALFVKMTEVSKLLLQAGADPYIVDYSGSTAMEYAQLQIHYNGCYEEHCHNAEVFWDSGELNQLVKQMSFDTSFIQERQFGRLHKVVLQKNSERLRKELESSTRDINMGDSNGCTPLQWAAIRNDPECLRLLLVHGANPNLHDKGHCLPIHEISWHRGQDESDLQKRDRRVQLFIQDGTSMYEAQFVNKSFHRFWTPLIKACCANRHAVVVMLLAAGAQIQPNGAAPANALAACIRENSHDSLGHILREKEQLKNMTVIAWWSILHATQCSADARTLHMLVDEELTIKGLTSEDWEWLACLTASRESARGLITNNTQRKFLCREFINGLRERVGFDPILSPLK
ncbi:uncharacterized protein PAC_07655 [Phialocephala subalpina]|uniref:Azaphilone pigments biosynthesis cluster protein L N-terminal domain-containing protein n=1 Tax=Phialocephala subalpina TaxID=576137 RepID=A0A1L7WYB6_9HELO|nr:uncharacterized protein PAC_07655 [Phialocephala subalpina]